MSNLDCPATCSAFGSPAINGATSGQALCGGTYQGVTYYGAWAARAVRAVWCSEMCLSMQWPGFGCHSTRVMLS